jgi:hypothetical protein
MHPWLELGAGTYRATTHATDHDAIKEEDPQDQPQLAIDSDDAEEDGPDEHLFCGAKATLRRLVGVNVEKTWPPERRLLFGQSFLA